MKYTESLSLKLSYKTLLRSLLFSLNREIVNKNIESSGILVSENAPFVYIQYAEYSDISNSKST